MTPTTRVAVAADAHELAERGPAAEELLAPRRAEHHHLGAPREVLLRQEAALGGVEVVHRLVGRRGARDLELLLEAGHPHQLLARHGGLHELERPGLLRERQRVVVGEALRLLLEGVLLHLARVELADEHLADAAGLVPELLALAPCRRR